MKKYIVTYLSPIGPLEITVNEKALLSIKPITHHSPPPFLSAGLPIVQQVQKALDSYFLEKKEHCFTAFSLLGTPFQKGVWQAAREIKFGQMASYKELAQKIGSPQSFRLVARALSMNPYLILVPCHRIIYANKKIGGFAGGVTMKRQLLQHEGNKISA